MPSTVPETLNRPRVPNTVAESGSWTQVQVRQALRNHERFCRLWAAGRVVICQAEVVSRRVNESRVLPSGTVTLLFHGCRGIDAAVRRRQGLEPFSMSPKERSPNWNTSEDVGVSTLRQYLERSAHAWN